MGTTSEALACDAGVLAKLNRLSVTRSFTPQVDVDWTQCTTDDEFAALYPAWSLLAGTGVDKALDAAGRVTYARYQQINLMLFTGLLERYAIGALAKAYDLDPAEDFSEYVGHFIKEEVYHHMMFRRGVELISATLPPGAPALPSASVERTLRVIFGMVNAMPSRKLRATLTFSILRFAEQVTIYANQTAQSGIARKESLVRQIWAFHALDESRHLVFDGMVIERNRLPGPVAWAARMSAAASCVVLSFLLNANELWMARQLGLRVHIWHLPHLMRRTQATFKRRVFGLLGETVRGGREAET